VGVANGPIVTVIPRKKRPVADPTDDTQVEEYSDTFISIRQSVIGSNQEDEIDLTPSTQPSYHDYSNLALSESQEGGAGGGGAGGNLVPMKKKPPKPIPFIAGNQAGSHATSTPPQPPARQNDRLGSPKPPARSGAPPKVPTRTGDSPKPAPRSSTEAPKPPTRPDSSKPVKKQQSLTEETKPSPPQARQSYDNPYQLKSKPPLKKKPSVPLVKTKPGSYDDPEEVFQYKEKRKPKKPPRDGLEVTVDNSEDILYDNPEEGVYNIPEAVYDEAGVNIAAEVAASPKFDDGIYMSSGGISEAVATKPKKPPTTGEVNFSLLDMGWHCLSPLLLGGMLEKYEY